MLQIAVARTLTHTYMHARTLGSPRALVVEYTCETQYHIERERQTDRQTDSTEALDTHWERVLPAKLEFSSRTHIEG